MMRDDVRNEYFEWLYNLVCRDRFSKQISFKKLLMALHHTEFIYYIPLDDNRADDGINMRRRFAIERKDPRLVNYLNGPCSVLEMMIALSMRCEETIMDDPAIGNRTGQWFWGMIANLGLGSMDDSNFNELYVGETVARFLNRDYEPDGKGGLFTVRGTDQDMRDLEIWMQLCHYLNTIM